MQIRSIPAAVVTIALMIQGWTAIASHDRRYPSETFILQAEAADTAETKTDANPEVKSEEVPKTPSDGQALTTPQNPATAVSVRNTRPREDRHKDARACLDAGTNEAIIRCAEKYR